MKASLTRSPTGTSSKRRRTAFSAISPLIFVRGHRSCRLSRSSSHRRDCMLAKPRRESARTGGVPADLRACIETTRPSPKRSKQLLDTVCRTKVSLKICGRRLIEIVDARPVAHESVLSERRYDRMDFRPSAVGKPHEARRIGHWRHRFGELTSKNGMPTPRAASFLTSTRSVVINVRAFALNTCARSSLPAASSMNASLRLSRISPKTAIASFVCCGDPILTSRRYGKGGCAGYDSSAAFISRKRRWCSIPSESMRTASAHRFAGYASGLSVATQFAYAVSIGRRGVRRE